MLLVDKNITYATIRSTAKILRNAGNIPFMGTVVRESDSRLEKEYEKYMRMQESKFVKDFQPGQR